VSVFKHEDIADAILCGHSYGGMVVTGVAGEIGERIRTLFYVDAYAPADGQSLLDITGGETALAFLDRASRSGGMIPPIPAAIFNVNEKDADRVDAMSGGAAAGDLRPRRADRCGVELRRQPHIRLRDRKRGRLVRFDPCPTEGSSTVEDAQDRVRAQHHAWPPSGTGLAPAGRSNLVSRPFVPKGSRPGGRHRSRRARCSPNRLADRTHERRKTDL
jgi:pimeloyl-ACP methyl ester carboxylesterase